MNRLASFCATGNKMKFLVDTTGNRRFLTFYVNGITNPYESPIDYEAVYAQAVAHVHAGLKTWFGGWEVQEIEEMNRRFMRNNIEHDLLLKYYQLLPSDAKAVPESFGNIMAHLSQMTGLKINERKLMEVLQELKVPTVEDSTTTCYMLHQLDAEEINVRRNLKKSMLEENDRAF
jgi:predicted P-loop ATPase